MNSSFWYFYQLFWAYFYPPLDPLNVRALLTGHLKEDFAL
jgi:hypothetical protein